MISVYYYIRIIKVLFFESKNLVPSNLEFQMTYPVHSQEIFINILVLCLVILIYLFFKPTSLYFMLMLAHDISL